MNREAQTQNEKELEATKAAFAAYVECGGRDPDEIARFENRELEGGKKNES